MKYYFLSGLPRAGNTIISCILNQNKDIGVSANSLLSEVLYHLNEMKKNDVAFNNFRDEKSYHSMLAGIIPSYYSGWVRGEHYLQEKLVLIVCFSLKYDKDCLNFYEQMLDPNNPLIKVDLYLKYSLSVLLL